MSFSRTRLLALVLVVVFSFAAVGATAIASATDTASAAKKSKKCKKGYKKVKGKCKKKKKVSKAAPKPETVVSGATLVLVRQIARNKVQVKGTVNFSKATASGVVPAVVNIVTAKSGNIAANLNIKVSGGETSQSFTEISFVPPFEDSGTATMTVVGITSNEVPLK